ncbi:MAG: ATP-binding protein, partial [Candidatus Dadabacteria bacterium]|nr:ATP-binding protein [Candidatus Dadabacteria bacterium]
MKYNLSIMIYSSEHIIEHLALGEDSHWEFKQVVFEGNRPKSPGRNDWADEMAAFANTNGGVLLCGVTDRREVQGMSSEQMDELERLLV